MVPENSGETIPLNLQIVKDGRSLNISKDCTYAELVLIVSAMNLSSKQLRELEAIFPNILMDVQQQIDQQLTKLNIKLNQFTLK